MTPERWQRISEIFEQVIDLAPAHREVFLGTVCAADHALRQEIESLLRHDRPDGEFLAATVAGVAASVTTLEDGDRIGAYRIESLIGSGGMGSVYLAWRTDDAFRKRAAIKVMNRGLDSPALQARFRDERKILARLDHPCIARLFDGGATADGLPFLVMEYVDGLPLTQYIRDRGVAVSGRLFLFREICSAVSHAHQNLIAHRDVKPPNILVTPDGTPKLLDFGIARLLDSPADPSTLRVHTPDYASPEQIHGRSLTTATDVYSLGVLLCEILTGKRPADPSALTSLRGDLRDIVVKATQTDPSHRYGSVQLLAEDIRRHQESLPVRARTPTLAYRAGKTLRRHGLVFAAAAAVLLSLSVGIVAATSQTRRAERRLALLDNLAYTYLFDFHDRVLRLPDSGPVRTGMLRTANQYLQILETEAHTRPELARRIADGYDRLGDIQADATLQSCSGAALASYRKAVRLRELIPAGTEAHLMALASSHARMADCAAHTAELPSASAAYGSSIQALERAGQLKPDFPERLELAKARLNYGRVLERLGRLNEALAQFQQAGDELLRDIADTQARRVRLRALLAEGDLLGNPRRVNLGRPSDAAARFRMARRLATREDRPVLAGALEADDMLTLEPNPHVAALSTPAPAALSLKRIQQAIESAQQDWYDHPHDIFRLRNLADAYEAQALWQSRHGDRAEVRDSYETIRQLWVQWQRSHGPGPYDSACLRRISDMLARVEPQP